MIYFASFRGWIVTANADGTIPLNAKTVCQVSQMDLNEDLLKTLLAQANRKDPEEE